MNILILANNDVGLYNFRKELLERLIQEGHSLTISLPFGNRVNDLIQIGCEYIETNVSRHGKNPINDFKLVVKYGEILKKVKPDVVLSYTIKPNIYGGIACEIMKIPYIVNITGLGTAVENGGWMQKLTVLLYRIAFCKVNKVFFQNTENMKFFNDRKIAVKKYGLLPGSGVNTEKFSYIEYPEDEVVKFVFISRIMKEKGIDQFLEAAKYIKNEYPNTEFHICGFCEKEYQGSLKEYIDDNTVICHGMVKDVKMVLKDMHCIVHPSYYEGMSNVLLEASACGRPCICSDIPGCREIVDDGINGFLSKPRDAKSLIDAMEQFLALSKKEQMLMGEAGRKKVEYEFDRTIIVDTYINVISQIKEEKSNGKPL